MNGFLYGMLGAVAVDVLGLAAAALVLPRLLKKAMRKQMGAAMFGSKPAGARLSNGEAATTATYPERNRA